MIYVLLLYHLSAYSGEIDKIQIIGEFESSAACHAQIKKNGPPRDPKMKYACGEQESD